MYQRRSISLGRIPKKYFFLTPSLIKHLTRLCQKMWNNLLCEYWRSLPLPVGRILPFLAFSSALFRCLFSNQLLEAPSCVSGYDMSKGSSQANQVQYTKVKYKSQLIFLERNELYQITFPKYFPIQRRSNIIRTSLSNPALVFSLECRM